MDMNEVMKEMMEIIGFLFPLIFWGIIILIISGSLRIVPANTVLVIDRKSHYLKTKRKGLYFFNPLTDVVTSKISTSPTRKQYNNVFENHESNFYDVFYWVSYKAEDVEQVISSLSDSRRSIDDIINCAMEVLFTSFDNKEAYSSTSTINQKFHAQLESMLEPFYIDVLDTGVTVVSSISPIMGEERKFQRHVSGGGSSGDPIR